MEWRFLYQNGAIYQSPDVPHVSNLLESRPGAYTTTRTHNKATCLLFFSRHLRRLTNSATILLSTSPHLFFKSNHTSPLPPSCLSLIAPRLNQALDALLPIALPKRNPAEELAITALVTGNTMEKSGLEVYVHGAWYVPAVFGESGACVAVVGPGRDVAEAKYSDWVRLRKPLEKLRPDSVTELLLSNDGDHLLEGCITNFFVVSRKENHDLKDTCPFEVQTAPVASGVLPGIIRQVVFEVCLSKGISIREVAPSWSKRELWQEAFITNSLRIIQHVKKIQVPKSWESLQLKTLGDISWEEKLFGDTPGMITATIQVHVHLFYNCTILFYFKEIMEKAITEGNTF